jgi:hypothetical protein
LFEFNVLYLPWMNVSKCYFEELLTVHLFVHKANLPMGNHKEPIIYLMTMILGLNG